MELNIDRIQVTVENVDGDQSLIAAEVERYIRAAFDQILEDRPQMGCPEDGVFNMTLPDIDWDNETDKAGKIAEMVRERLFEGVERL